MCERWHAHISHAYISGQQLAALPTVSFCLEGDMGSRCDSILPDTSAWRKQEPTDSQGGWGRGKWLNNTLCCMETAVPVPGVVTATYFLLHTLKVAPHYSENNSSFPSVLPTVLWEEIPSPSIHWRKHSSALQSPLLQCCCRKPEYLFPSYQAYIGFWSKTVQDLNSSQRGHLTDLNGRGLW